MENIYAQRIEALRRIMAEKGWDAIVMTGSDPHSSEYPAKRWKQVEWITGFSGEAGDIVITGDHAGLWTDTRYFIAAAKALEGTGMELHKTRVPDQILIPEWIAGKFDSEKEIVVAVDGLSISAGFVQEIVDATCAVGTECLVADIPDLLDLIWENRPQIPCTTVFTVDSGEERKSKIAWLRDVIDADGILISSLDEIAWMLNVRASDIEYNPLVISYLLLTQESVKWFVLKGWEYDATTRSTYDTLRAEGIEILPYESIEMALDAYEGSLQIDLSTLNHCMYNAIKATTVNKPSPVCQRKAVKNVTEVSGMRKCHLQDGVAMEKFLYWLEKSVEAQRCIDEWDASVKLGEFRACIPGYHGDSFETISAYRAGAALPHYVTPRENAPILYEEGLYLVDSGGQYDSGTTDITRTVPLGKCSKLEKEDYTLVLKGHIDLAMAVFPNGTAGCHLDVLAREPLWRTGRNFGHGTGHGVGYFLGVHEGPAEFRQNFNSHPLLPGMTITDEPGLYREGMHGIRHENVLLVCEKEETEFGRWLCFEPLTLCHFDTGAIIPELLGDDEIKWLNSYNAKVYSTLKSLLPSAVASWLKEKTKAI